MNTGDRFIINSNLNGHKHHKGAVYSITRVSAACVDAVNLNAKPEHRISTSFHKAFLAEFAQPVAEPMRRAA